MTSQWPDNCDASTWKVISNSLSVLFTVIFTAGRVRKNVNLRYLDKSTDLFVRNWIQSNISVRLQPYDLDAGLKSKSGSGLTKQRLNLQTDLCGSKWQEIVTSLWKLVIHRHSIHRAEDKPSKSTSNNIMTCPLGNDTRSSVAAVNWWLVTICDANLRGTGPYYLSSPQMFTVESIFSMLQGNFCSDL